MAITNILAKPATHIRSFSRRQGRITASQQAALNSLWNVFGLDPTGKLCPSTIFARPGPLILDIGFGNGDTLVETAERNPEKNFIGIDVHRPGIGRLLAQLQERNLQNVRVYFADAVDILNQNISDASIDGVNLFFPDPWPKKRHRKRRLVNPVFADLVGKKLRTGGRFYCATDWEDYALQMLETLNDCTVLKNTASNRKFVQKPVERGVTKFERRGIRLGHQIWDLIFERI